MPHSTFSDERGFSLVELLVVIFIIGILAAIALPNFIVQRAKGQDAVAKSNARSALTYVEACYTPHGDYADCTQRTRDSLGADLGFEIGNGPGQVLVEAGPVGSSVDGSGFRIRAHSESGNHFDILKPRSGAPVVRECEVPSGAGGRGACPSDGRW